MRVRATKTMTTTTILMMMMMRKLNEEWKWERSQQIKFPLDGIILTANDIKQVFYVHRAVKFIHAHISLSITLYVHIYISWCRLDGCRSRIYLIFLSISLSHQSVKGYVLIAIEMRFRLLTATWCVCTVACEHERVRAFGTENPTHANRMMYNGISYGKINAMRRFWCANKYEIEFSGK